VTFNPVWSIFDFAVVVSNLGSQDASVSISGPNGFTISGTVSPLGLQTFYLPWVPALKGKDADCQGTSTAPSTSVVQTGGAYHLTSNLPVVVYQFNAIEYRGAGGRSGKDWSSCPGLMTCNSSPPVGCYSFTNDASLLLPSTAMTGNYRVTALEAAAGASFVAISGITAGTTVKVLLSAAGYVLAGGSIMAGTPGTVLTFMLGEGDVAEILADDSQASADLSGSQVQASQPVQVIAGSACASLPVESGDAGASLTCDHIEETVLPAETLGQHYVVTVPTAPLGKPVGHIVRFYGNVDGTHLTYPSGDIPPNAPSTLSAGQVIDLGEVKVDFEVTADQAFAVGTFSLSGEIQDPNDILSRGDPAQSQAVAVEQYRKAYVFLAPNDYDESFVDVVLPSGANVSLDGADLPARPQPLGGTSWEVARVRLGDGIGGSHVLTSDQPVGIQIMGYGAYTAYQYPSGLNLQRIAPPPAKVQ
jgi:hypothetical protein